DGHVTGVQTCALPISRADARASARQADVRQPKMRTRRDDARAADHRSRAHPRIAQTSAASVSRVVSTTSRPARKPGFTDGFGNRSEEHTSELQSRGHL